MFLTGLAIFVAMLFVFVKLPRRTLLRLLRYDLAIDVFVTLLVLLIHWGTFSGVMAATVTGLMTSLATTGAKRLFGHLRGEEYVSGLINLRA